MRPLPLFVIGLSSFAGGIALNSDGDNRLAAREVASATTGAKPDTTLPKLESSGGTVLAIVGLVLIGVGVAKAVGK